MEKVIDGILVPDIKPHILETQGCARWLNDGREDPPSRDSERECVWNDQPQRETTQSIVNRDAIFRFPGRADVTKMFGVVVLLKDPILIVGSKYLLYRF